MWSAWSHLLPTGDRHTRKNLSPRLITALAAHGITIGECPALPFDGNKKRHEFSRALTDGSYYIAVEYVRASQGFLSDPLYWAHVYVWDESSGTWSMYVTQACVPGSQLAEAAACEIERILWERAAKDALRVFERLMTDRKIAALEKRIADMLRADSASEKEISEFRERALEQHSNRWWRWKNLYAWLTALCVRLLPP